MPGTLRSVGFQPLSIQPIVDVALARVRSHELAQGHYRRFFEGSPTSDPYGCADAVNLLYTLSALPTAGANEAKHLVAALQSHQRDDGLFREATHHPYHTTAHCLGALELLEARPLRRLTALEGLRDIDTLLGVLDALPWRRDPWRASHRGSGIYAALVLAGEVEEDWEDAYFGWLETEWDEATGLLRKGAIHSEDYDATSPDEGAPCLFHDLASTFHYVFNIVHANRTIPHAEALIDTCLRVFEARLYPLCERVGFAEIDWVYSVHRALRQCGHRRDETELALASIAERYVRFLRAGLSDPAGFFNDLHTLFGAVCTLAELQLALPERFLVDRTLRQVLDRRPFI